MYLPSTSLNCDPYMTDLVSSIAPPTPILRTIATHETYIVQEISTKFFQYFDLVNSNS